MGANESEAIKWRSDQKDTTMLGDVISAWVSSFTSDAWGLVKEEVFWVGRTVLAGMLAALIGIEREQAGKAAGVRTLMLVGIASCTFASVGELVGGKDDVRYDPLRAVAAVATGIGFLGAGIIFVSPGRHRVRGLTTAASIWAVSAIAVTVAFRNYVFAILMTGILYGVLHCIGFYQHKEEKTLKKEDVLNPEE
jgi:putative Mg2+ transporter-C (MgtC) family protein